METVKGETGKGEKLQQSQDTAERFSSSRVRTMTQEKKPAGQMKAYETERWRSEKKNKKRLRDREETDGG